MPKDSRDNFFDKFKLTSSRPLSEADIPILIQLYSLNIGKNSSETKANLKQIDKPTNQQFKGFRWIPYEGEKDGTVNQNYFFGLCYMKGVGVQQSDYETLSYFLLAAQEGCAVAQNNVGYAFAEGRLTDPSPHDAFHYFKISADNDQPVALYNLAQCYMRGFGTEASESKSIEALFRACQLGDPIATHTLLVAGIQCDIKALSDYLPMWKELAKQGNPIIQWKLGEFLDCYKEDNLSKRDAFYYLKLSADRGVASAQWKVANYLREGKGIKKNLEEADRYLQLAIDQGYNMTPQEIRVYYNSQFENPEHVGSRELSKSFLYQIRKHLFLANLPDQPNEQYLTGLFFAGHPERKGALEQAFILFEKAALQNHPSAQYQLAKCYREGKGVEKSDISALFWLKKAVEAGEKDALLDLGMCYHKGKGVEQSDEEAYRYWKLLADKGFPHGDWMVACCYYYGKGVPQSNSDAFRYARLAAEKGSLAGLQSTGCCYLKGIGTEKDERKAFECFELAALKGDSLAEYRLGICYEQGLGVEKNVEEAIRHFQAAAEKGLQKAQMKLDEAA